MALCFLLFCLPICSWCDVFFTFLSGEGRIPALTSPTVITGATVKFGVIVRSAGLAVVATDARARTDDTNAGAGGPGPASPLIFLHLAMHLHLHLQRSIGGLAWEVPLNSHCIGDFHPCGWVWLTGHKEDGCFLRTTINMILPPFRSHS